MKFKKFNEAALEKFVQQAAAGAVDDLNRMLAGMVTEYAGRPVDEIKPVLAQRWRQTTHDGYINDPELSAFATEISEGRRPEVGVDEEG